MAKPLHDAGRRVTAFCDRGNHQVGAAHRIAASKDGLGTGLIGQAARVTGDDAAVVAALHPGVLQPGRQAGREAEGDDHHVRFQQRFTALDGLGIAPAIGIGRAQLGFHHGDADHFVIGAGLDRQRLTVEQKAHAFLAGIGHLTRRAGHGGLVAAVGTGDAGRTETDGTAYAVHAGIATTEYQHALAGQIRQGNLVFPAGDRAPGRVIAGDDAAVVHQEGQGRQYAFEILPGQAAIGVAVGTGADKHGIEFGQQVIH